MAKTSGSIYEYVLFSAVLCGDIVHALWIFASLALRNLPVFGIEAALDYDTFE